MKVLVACEYSGTVRDAFIKRGHDAISCDILETESPGPHYKGDVRDILIDQWDLIIAHPPCTYLSVSGLHWNKNDPVRAQKTEDGLNFVKLFFNAYHYGLTKRLCIENPVSCISSRIRKPDCIVQPYNFGHDASKKTCLWLENLPVLQNTKYVPGRIVDGKMRWANQTDSGQNRLGPSDDRAKIRSLTYQGIADAMADQWGSLND